jgi:hypothetical protein
VSTADEAQAGKALRSWKEISAYLGVTVRSAQRWEKTLRMPVHRQGAGRNARIFAYPAELDAWLASSKLTPAQLAENPPSAGRHRWGWAILSLVLLLAGAAAWDVTSEFGAREPRNWTADGQTLRILDGQGRLCWEKHFPSFHVSYAPNFRDRVRIEDTDGDGEAEILFNFNPRDPNRPGGLLFCFDRLGRKVWEHVYGAKRTFGDRLFERHFHGQIVQPLRVNGRPLVLVGANHDLWYPARMALLDARTGQLVDEYWHPGAIYFLSLVDLEGDGNQEVLFGGINNPGDGPGHAALGVLALPFSNAPKRTFAANDPLRPPTGGGELAYLLFPLADVARATGQLPLPALLRFEGGRRILFQTPLPEFGGIVYSLDLQLNVTAYHISSNLEALHARLESQNLLRHPWNAAEKAELGSVARFTAAPDGNSPAVRARWNFNRLP